MNSTHRDIGQFFVVSFPESVPCDETLYFIEDNRIGGIILFAHHCRDLEGLATWLSDLKKSIGHDLIVAVDQEGGRVCRFTRGFPPLESPRYYGEKDRLNKYRSDLSRVCEVLREIGVNCNLIPTIDLFNSGKNHVLDSRTFSDRAEVVNRFARTAIEVLQEQGLLSCAKHFPGLGRSVGDPHQVLSTAELTEKDFFETELRTFEAAIESGVDAVMVTHLSAPKADSVPSIISEKMISGWLKDRLAFTGPVFTDDLLMEAVTAMGDRCSAAQKSFAAGADFLLFGQDLKKVREVYARFVEAWQSGTFDPLRIIDAKNRVEEFKHKIDS
jgi:beta-N-acetylhexosaminidase